MHVLHLDNRRTQWDDPRFNDPNLAGEAVPYSRDYKQKYEYLKIHLPKPLSNVPNKFEMHIRRDHVLEDSYRAIMSVSENQVDRLKTKLWIELAGEVVFL